MGVALRAWRWLPAGLTIACAALGLLGLPWVGAVWADGPGSTVERPDAVDVDRADSTARTFLEQVRTYRENQQWDEAVETLRQVMANSGDKLVRLDAERHCTLREYGHRLLANFDEAARELYRSRVDAQAEGLFHEAVRSRSAEQLRELIDELYHSSWTDDALWAWGEMALEQGNGSGARAAWEQLIPAPAEGDGPALRLACSQSDVPLADVRARLILASILEGDLVRATSELAAYRELHPQAHGRMAGRDIEYAEALASILQSAQQWPSAQAGEPWSTFAGNRSRDAMQSGMFEMGAVAWKRDLDPTPLVDASLYRSMGYRPRRVAEDPGPLLSYHPVLYRDLVLVAGPRGISAFRAATGEPAWSREQALIYQDGDEDPGRRATGRSALGVPRYTLTVSGSRLYARLGSPVTADAVEATTPHRPGYLVCLDLEAEGKLLWKITPPGEGWGFEGTPLALGDALYVGLRRRDVKPQAHVACYDAQTGQQRWSRFVCAAPTPAARSQAEECTHNLLTLVHDTLYYNTSLGAVAALSVHDGRIRWLTEYPRGLTSGLSRSAAHLYRDLTPCLYHRGRVLVAPADSEAIVALDAADGQVLWATQHPSDAVHLLGIGGENLIVSGDRLWWIHLASGKVIAQWPEGPSPQGYGRGLVVDDSVYWPTREEIHVFDASSGAHQRVISITSRWPDLTTGNLLLAGERLLMATANKVGGNQLVAFQRENRLEPNSLPLTLAVPARERGGWGGPSALAAFLLQGQPDGQLPGVPSPALPRLSTNAPTPSQSSAP